MKIYQENARNMRKNIHEVSPNTPLRNERIVNDFLYVLCTFVVNVHYMFFVRFTTKHLDLRAMIAI
jgi:hypothetical protein